MRLPALLVAGLTVAPLVIAVPAPAVTAPGPAKANDFNGDGEHDFAVASRFSPRNSDDKARGRVSVIYGGRHRVQTLTPQSLRLPGFTVDMSLGEALTSADFDRDGFADLAITAFGYRKVIIVYGSRKGLSSRRALLPVDSRGGNTTLVTGDFDGDRRPDLSVTLSSRHWLFTEIGRGSNVRSTPPSLLGYHPRPVAADFTGDGITDLVHAFAWHEKGTTAKLILFKGSKNGLGRPVETDLVKVRSVAAGDVNGDGRTDLVAGTALSSEKKDGRVRVAYGTEEGLSKPVLLSGLPKQGRDFGASVSVRDVNGDRYADVAVGDPREETSKNRGGAVVVLRGSRKGITAKGAQIFTQETKGVPGGGEPHDAFGQIVRLTDLTGDGRADLVIASSGEAPDGRLLLLKNHKGKITTKGLKIFSGKRLGFVDSSWEALP
ncbi:VCBS repeat-containing protein [Actinocorallia aurantiaca]|uniref:FG-GAP repeat protein n=1 Tax=Actinocorallia aurantiaca TaxID=46204 RepID=A0ABP6GZA9_9ACTN